MKSIVSVFISLYSIIVHSYSLTEYPMHFCRWLLSLALLWHYLPCPLINRGIHHWRCHLMLFWPVYTFCSYFDPDNPCIYRLDTPPQRPWMWNVWCTCRSASSQFLLSLDTWINCRLAMLQLNSRKYHLRSLMTQFWVLKTWED